MDNIESEEITEQQEKIIIDGIIKYTKLGYKIPEIAIIMRDYHMAQLFRIRRDYEEKNGWFARRQLNEFKRLRRIREEKGEFKNLSIEKILIIEQARAIEEKSKSKQAEFFETLRTMNKNPQETTLAEPKEKVRGDKSVDPLDLEDIDM